MNFGFLLSLTFILIVTSVFSKNSNDILIRRKRYLVFPEGASMTIAFCLTSQTYVYPPTIFTQNLAWGIAYNLPNDTTSIKGFLGPKFLLKRRNRRDVYGKMEQIMDSMGYNGRSCILKALCEASHKFLSKDDTLSQLILKIIFGFPKEPVLQSEPEDHRIYHWASQIGKSEDDCWETFIDCPFSLIDMALGYYSDNNY